MSSWTRLVPLVMLGCSAETGVPDMDQSPSGCGLHTAYIGDERCLPPAASGAELHFGPADYDDPGSFVVLPGSDELYCVDVAVPANLRYVTGYTASFRPGVHHFSIHARRTGAPDPVLKPCGNLPGSALLPITADGERHGIAAGPEYEGAGIELPADTISLPLDIHWINATSEPMLVEGWIHLETGKPSTLMGLMELSGGTQMSVPPMSTSVVKIPAGACQIPADLRIASLSSHQHSHGKRVSIYLDSDLVYENYDWQHPYGARYSSAYENPIPDRTAKLPGAASGVLVPGSRKISWECEIENTLDSTILYGINTQKREMCVIGGFVTPAAPDGRPLTCVEP